MKHRLYNLTLAFFLSQALAAAPEDFRIEIDPSTPGQPLKLKWWGNPDIYYVIESSLDLRNSWDEYFYAIKGVAGTSGAGQLEAMQFAPFPETDRTFFRLRFDSDPFSLLGRTDHDGDGIPTALELDAQMNATVAENFVDSDGDGLPDYWEIFYFGDLSRDGSEDFDDDGTLDADEWANRTHPTDSNWDIPYWNDEDADMLNASVESLLGTNLNSTTPASSPAVIETAASSTGSDLVLVVGRKLMELDESNTASILNSN